MPAGGVRTLLVRFQGDSKGLANASQQAGKQVDSWRDKMKKFNAVAVKASLAVGAAAVVAARDAFILSNQLRDLDAKSKAVFEDQLGTIRNWAEANKAAFGTSRDQVVGLAANMADLLKPMGFTAEQATAMTTEMLDLSGALAQWSGGQATAAEVSDILTKAMLGEREQLKTLGISISEAEVKARLAAKGQEDLTGQALAQAKAIATQELILEKSTDAQTAWANGGKEAAEAQNASKVTIQELREALARGLTPAFEAGTKIAQKFAKWAEKNQTTLKVLLGVVVGLAAAILVINVVLKVWRAAVVVATAAQWAWNIAMKANPIGLIILAIAALIAITILVVKNWDTVKRVFFQVWDAIWNFLKAFGRWIARVFWENGLKKYFTLWGNIIGWVRDRFREGIDKVKSFVAGLLERVKSLPDRIKSGFSNLFNIITAPFRAAFNFVADAWNNTIGKLSWTVPGWVPIIGGNSISAPKLPRFHTGGVIPGPLGAEVPIIARAGERVLTREQDQALGGGVFEGTLTLDSGEFLGVVTGVLRQRDRGLKRAALAGAGAAR